MLESLSRDSGNGTRSQFLLSISLKFFVATVVVNALFWIIELAIDLRYTGPFYFFGVDWSRFWGAAKVFVTAGPRAAYQLAAIAQAMQPFASYYGSGSDFGLVVRGLRVGPAPYPPIFLYFFSLFTLPPLAVGFALWTILNVALAIWILWQLTSGLAPGPRSLLVTLLMLSYPLVIEFYVGQLVILILFGFYMAYRDLLSGREFRAGMWLASLLLKPQYLLVLVLVLLYKRRWNAFAGVTAGGLVVLAASLAVGGIGGIVGYVRMILVDYPKYSGGTAIDPHSLITWRGMVFDALPWLGSTSGLALTAILSILSLAALVPIWNKGWAPRGQYFHVQMLATMIVTQLVAYHSHVHGAILLFVPAVLMIVARRASRPMQWLMAIALVGPPLVAGFSALFFRDLRLISMLYILVMTAGLILILLGQPELSRDEAAAERV